MGLVYGFEKKDFFNQTKTNHSRQGWRFQFLSSFKTSQKSKVGSEKMLLVSVLFFCLLLSWFKNGLATAHCPAIDNSTGQVILWLRRAVNNIQFDSLQWICILFKCNFCFRWHWWRIKYNEHILSWCCILQRCNYISCINTIITYNGDANLFAYGTYAL